MLKLLLINVKVTFNVTFNNIIVSFNNIKVTLKYPNTNPNPNPQPSSLQYHEAVNVPNDVWSVLRALPEGMADVSPQENL